MSTILPTENQDWGFWGIRQVGPNKDGARGSYTIYKVAG